MRKLTRVLLAAAMAVGCATEFDPSERPRYWNGSTTVTLYLFDGQSGAAITDAEVNLHIGADVVTATGEGNIFTLAQLPRGSYPLFVKAPGYLDFVASMSFTNNNSLSNATAERTFESYTVAMFPVQSVETDITVRVFEGEEGTAVASGQLVAALDPNTSFTTPSHSLAKSLNGTLGFLPRVITVPLTDGVATVPADQLVFGATYQLSVINARDADGRYLSPEVRNQTIKAGIGAQDVLLFVGPPAVTPVALSANNEDAGVFVSKLVVNFPYPVELCSTAADHSWTNLTNDGPNDQRDSDDDGKVTLPVADGDSVRVTLTQGGAVLTVDYLADDEDKEDSLRLRFDGVRVRVAGSNACSALSNVSLRDSNAVVSTTIDVREYVEPEPEEEEEEEDRKSVV